MMKRIFERIAREVNYLGFRKYRFGRQVRHYMMKYYSPENPKGSNREKLVVFMADGKVRHGGLGDRLRGIVSLFALCREKGYQFRIFFNSPFTLEKYLLPNQYDWRISPEEMSYNSEWSLPVYNDTRKEYDDREKRWQRRVLGTQIAPDYRQIHSYNTFYFAEDNFRELFNTLFRPAPCVEEAVAKVKENMEGSYISISTRFLMLLGDFKEPKNIWKVLDEEEGENLMRLCLDKIKEIQNLPENRGKMTLITSDSTRFLNFVANEPYIYVIPGNISHIDTKKAEEEDQLKTFVDFFTIKDAERSYLVVGPDMYRSSNFAKRAAQADGRDVIIMDA